MGETPETALVRELDEELGIQAEPGSEITRYEFVYPGRKPILLIFLRVTAWQGEIENRIFETLCWEAPGALPSYDFLEGDIPFLAAFIDPESRMERRAPGSVPSCE